MTSLLSWQWQDWTQGLHVILPSYVFKEGRKTRKKWDFMGLGKGVHPHYILSNLPYPCFPLTLFTPYCRLFVFCADFLAPSILSDILTHLPLQVQLWCCVKLCGTKLINVCESFPKMRSMVLHQCMECFCSPFVKPRACEAAGLWDREGLTSPRRRIWDIQNPL